MNKHSKHSIILLFVSIFLNITIFFYILETNQSFFIDDAYPMLLGLIIPAITIICNICIHYQNQWLNKSLLISSSILLAIIGILHMGMYIFMMTISGY